MPKRKQIDTTDHSSVVESSAPAIVGDDEPEIITPDYTSLFPDGDTIAARVEDVCVPMVLEPFYNALISITYEGKRVTSLSRDHGIFRLWLEDGTQAAVISGQLLTVTKQAVQEAVEEPAADGDAAG